MASQPPFALSRATVEDIPEIVTLMHEAFNPDVSEYFTGCKGPANYPKYIEMVQQRMQEHNDIVWLKVVDVATGQIAAGSQWRIHVSNDPEHPDILPPPWLREEIKESSMRLHEGLNGARTEAMKGGPFIYLHICFTDAKYRRRGAGALMLQWGVDLADLLSVPAWIEASKDGNALYKNFGFYDYEERTYENIPFLNMKRDVRKDAIVGGK